ncbi:MAG: DNA polymerase bacteriophage-type [Rhodobacteraceae bacterium HLUCCA09]|nr:MAG: DNA polymerase bacteriophage-type [Rhodobacteraceae bacterium HLUCCA09]
MMPAPSRSALIDALAWQVELGVTEAIGDVPVDRTALPDRAPWLPAPPGRNPAGPAATAPTRVAPARPAPPPAPAPDVDTVEAAEAAATGARTIDALRAAMEAFPHCALRQGARQLVFADGRPGARLMIVGEAPGREEDETGLPFVGRAGRLLDLMFAPVGLSRTAPDLERALYITNILPWRPPQNRDPRPDEIAMMKPFLARHVELARPDLLIAMGNISCQALLGRRGITRLRGTWTEALGLPCLPMFHPAYLLRNPAAKREAWADVLEAAARLEAR